MVTSLKYEVRIVVEGVELILTQVGDSVSAHRVTGRDRRQKVDITSGLTFTLDQPAAAIILVEKMKRVAARPTARCTCDYHYGYSDHAEHCQSIYVAEYDGACVDDD